VLGPGYGGKRMGIAVVGGTNSRLGPFKFSKIFNTEIQRSQRFFGSTTRNP
jgi:hypothetical protein